jgi:hypothetical protein
VPGRGDCALNERHALPITGLEAIYDALAQAIDQAGPQRSELLLVKLGLLSAQALGDHTAFLKLIDQALQDLDDA